jgi:hypothetical protein
MSKRLGIFCIIFLSVIQSRAQQFAGTPPEVRWSQINTDSVRIIFPAGLDSTAQRVASITHYLAARKPVSSGNQQRKINIVLQNQTTVSNGYVTLGPFRSEFYLTPPANSFEQGSISWTDQLSLHEYRHVQQFNNFNNGLSRLVKTLFGAEGYDLAINAAVPDWFYEGDAVYQETVLTRQGRGRLPLFLNAYPSLWNAGKEYSWMKLRNGSLKDYVPSHYHLGYLLVNYGYEKYGTDFWRKVTHDASAYKGLLYPFQSAIKRHAGIEYKTFYNNAFAYYKNAEFPKPANEKAATTIIAPFVKELTTARQQYVTNYLFPYSLSPDSLLYLRRTYRHRPAFFIKDAKGEHKLRVKDVSLDDQFSYRNGRIVYAAYEPDARWGWRNYSVLKVLDVKTGKQTKLTNRTKYFTPDISFNGERIAAVEVAISGKSELHILDAATGEVKNRIRSQDILLFTDPKFVDDSSVVTAVRLKDGKMALALADIHSGATIRLTAPSYNVVGFPSVDAGIVYFTASYGGNDDVFALRLSDRKVVKITNGNQSGKYFVNAANGKMTWSSFTADGYQLQQSEQVAIDWDRITDASDETMQAPFPVSQDGQLSTVLADSIPDRVFAIEKYKKGTRLFNFHSWRPYYEDPIFTFSLYGENILNTLQTEIYYLYNQNEKTNAVGFTAMYGAWFPYLSIGSEYTFNRERPLGNKIRQWDQVDSRIGLNVPLNLTSGRSLRQLNMGTSYFYHRELNKGFFKDSLGSTGFSYLHHFISFSQQSQRAEQHIFPKWGANFSANYRYAISDVDSWQFLSSASIYLPGLAANHSLVLSGAFQEIDTLVSAFSNRFSYSRGYNSLYFARMWRMSGNYHFPVIHPDFGLANILFIQRVRGNAFYDFTRVYSRDKTEWRDQRSVGGEIFFDTKWWNQYELTFGLRVSRLLDYDFITGSKETIFEVLLPVSIFPR